MTCFGEVSTAQITKTVEKSIHILFYNKLSEITALQTVEGILKDKVYNMKNRNGEDYKEYAVNLMQASAAKIINEKYFI